MIVPLLFGYLLVTRFGFGRVFVFRVGISNPGMRESFGAAQPPRKLWEVREWRKAGVKEPDT